MKKIIFIAVFSLAIMSSTTKNISDNVENVSNKEAMFFGCGSAGNGWYAEYRNQGYSHRDARELRRIKVRECRGNGPGGWLNLPVRF